MTVPYTFGTATSPIPLSNLDANFSALGSSSNITYNSSVTRTVSSKLSDIISVKDFGAIGDGVTDDTTSIQNALQYGCDNQYAVYVPAGTYLLNSQINVTLGNGSKGASLNVHGDGQQASIFIPSVSNTDGCIKVTCVTNACNTQFSDLGFGSKITQAISGVQGSTNGTALWIYNPNGPTSGSFGLHGTNSIIVERIFVGSYVSPGITSNVSVGSWTYGIRGDNMWYPTVRNCVIWGLQSNSYPTSPVKGINIGGIVFNECYGPNISNINLVGYYDYGIWHHGTKSTGNNEQGGVILNCSIVNQDIGIRVDHSNTVAPYPFNLAFEVFDCAINSNSYCISVLWQVYVIVANCYFLNAHGSARNGPTVQGVATVGSLVGGSGYTNGTYTNVPLTGGTGQGAYATVIVSGGAVTSVTITDNGFNGYIVGDVLSAASSDIGGTGSGFTINVSSVAYLPAFIYGQALADTTISGCQFSGGYYTSNTNSQIGVLFSSQCQNGNQLTGCHFNMPGIGILNNSSWMSYSFSTTWQGQNTTGTFVKFVDNTGSFITTGGTTSNVTGQVRLESSKTVSSGFPRQYINSLRTDYSTNTTGSLGGLWYTGLNSSGVEKTSSVVNTNWLDNTSGSEKSQLQLYISDTGSLVNVDFNASNKYFNIPAGYSYKIGQTAGIYAGVGSPNSVVTAPTGSIYLNQSGGSGTTLYVKESGSGNTGWVGK